MSSKQHPALQDRRANFAHNAASLALIDAMLHKQSNLCVSADLTSAAGVLALAEAVGPYICMLKTHADIMDDFSPGFVSDLERLAAKHQFVIFEDRKFADIGNTVMLQYSAGVHKIAKWSHFTNAHCLPGDGIVQGLKHVGHPLGRGLLLLAQMSSAGSLCTPLYTDEAVAMALRHTDFVVGFIAQSRLNTGTHDFLILTPGVHLEASGDSTGQLYRSPEDAVRGGTDVVIVGRGIYAATDPAAEACKYQKAAWDAYLALLD